MNPVVFGERWVSLGQLPNKWLIVLDTWDAPQSSPDWITGRGTMVRITSSRCAVGVRVA